MQEERQIRAIKGLQVGTIGFIAASGYEEMPARLRVASKLPHASGSRTNAFRRGWYFEGYARWVKYPRLSRGIFIVILIS